MSPVESSLRDLVRELVREVLAEERAAVTNPDELLTVDEAAAIAKVKPATIRAWTSSGRLRHQRIGRMIRIGRRDLDSLGTSTRRQSAPSTEERARLAVARLLGQGK